MKKMFLYVIILFAFFQIKSSADADLLAQIYTKICNDQYCVVKADLTKNIESLTIKNIKTVLELLKNKKSLYENTINLNSGFANSSKTAASIIGLTWLTAICTSPALKFLNDTREVLSDRNNALTVDFKKTFYNKKLCFNILATIITSIATYYSGKNLFDVIYNNKKVKAKKLIEEIMVIETYLKNRLLILNQ